MAGWFFKELVPGIVRRTSHEEEFFIATTKVDAMVREAVQNSIDAKRDVAETVLVRFHLGIAESGVGDLVSSGLIEHLNATGIGEGIDFRRSSIPFLAIEDFNTTGLTGEIDPISRSAQNGDFYNFWWADGSLKKKGQSGGRWGLGKHTFFVSSKIRTIWGLCVRNDSPQKVLMGRCLLKPHIINDSFYNQDGFFTNSLKFDPILSTADIEKFESIFKLERKQFQGLSLIIPFPFDKVDSDTILKAVLDQYLFSIVRGKVKINISDQRNEGNDTQIILNKNNLFETIQRKKISDPKNFASFESLAKLYKKVQESNFDLILNTKNPSQPEIDEESFGDSINDLRKTFNNFDDNSLIKLKIPTKIFYPSNSPVDTYFEIAIAKSDDAPKKWVLCFRSGILVTEAISIDKKGIAIILIAEDDAIAQFLGDAENPSHTKWSARSENFSGRYINGKELLTFVMESPEKILKVLNKEPEIRDFDPLANIFYIEGQPKTKTKTSQKPTVTIKKRKVHPLVISQTEDGFSVSVIESENKNLGDVNTIYPFACIVQISYVVRSGNPLKKYDTNDFVLTKPPIELTYSGKGKLLEVASNSITIRIDGSDFALRAKGFDKNRDLYIKTTELTVGDGIDDNKET